MARFLVDLVAAFLPDFFFGDFLDAALAVEDFFVARFLVERVALPAVFLAVDRAAVDFFVAMYMAPEWKVPNIHCPSRLEGTKVRRPHEYLLIFRALMEPLTRSAKRSSRWLAGAPAIASVPGPR